jgi:hypothetical protein
MRDPRAVPTPLAEALARAALPLAGLAAMVALASREVDPIAAAESGYLAAVAACVLAAVAFLAPAPAFEAGLGTALATAAVWVLPAGPARGAAVLALLVAAFAVAAGRRLARCPPELPLAVTVPLAFGLQALLRGDLLLAPQRGPRVFVLLLLLPLAGAILTSSLSRRHGRRAAVAAGLALAATPGWTIATTLALSALAGGDALAAIGAGRSRRAAMARAAALAAVLLPLAWEPRAGGLAAAAGLALASPVLGLAGAAALAGASLLRTGGGLATLATALLCVPAAVRPAAGRWRWALAGGLLAFAARSFAPAGAPDLAALAAPLALLALATRDEGPAAVFQRTWTAALLGGAALFAAYPWLRERPLGDFLALLGPAPVAALAAVAGAAGLAFGADRWSGGGRTADERRPERSAPPRSLGSLAPAGIAAALLFLGILVHLPPPATPLLRPGEALRLSAGSPVWEARLPAAARGVALVSSLENGAEVAAGTPVATVALDGGAPVTLAAGAGTAEWAARRADVARELAARGERPPRPWVSWVAGDFFGQRYRRVFALPAAARPARPIRLRIELARGLPPDATLAVHHLEVLR